LARIFGATHRGVEIGIGDDAAVVEPHGAAHLILAARQPLQTWQMCTPWVVLLSTLLLQ
jgi:hypothetical protein